MPVDPKGLRNKVLDGYTDIFRKVCAEYTRYYYNKIINLNKRYLPDIYNIQNYIKTYGLNQSIQSSKNFNESFKIE